MPGVPSCGLTLLRHAPPDFVLTLCVAWSSPSPPPRLQLRLHRCVLVAHSEAFRTLLTRENYFQCTVSLQPGHLGAMLQILQYMYLKDTSLLSTDPQERQKIGRGVAFLRMQIGRASGRARV